MAQFSIELILVKQLASGLAIPTVVADASGTIVFINEPAERLLGVRFDELGDLPYEVWTSSFAPTIAHMPVESHELPLSVALHERRPAHGDIEIVGRDGIARAIEITAFPLESAHGVVEGGVAMFWETHRT